jgi:hypothetical protein
MTAVNIGKSVVGTVSKSHQLFHPYPEQFVGVLEGPTVNDLVDRYGFRDRFQI